MAVEQDSTLPIHILQRLAPDLLCFFLAESSKALVETQIHPQLPKMPQRWDSIITPDPQSFAQSHRVLVDQLPQLLNTWGVSPGELVIDLTTATPAMAAAMILVGFPYTSRVVTLEQVGSEHQPDPKAVVLEGVTRVWTQSNPWDEEAPQVRKEAASLFNRGAYDSAAQNFRRIERRVSGGLKPLYRALADVSEGYAQWERFHYRVAWDKLKSGAKALDLASAWGGPAELAGMVRTLKDNVRFLEGVVLDPQEVKPMVARDLLAQAKRRAERNHDLEVATKILLRALEAFTQSQLLKKYQIKSWDVRLDQLPQALKETCQTCYLSDVDGKYRLPLHAQFRTLAGLGDTMGQTFLAQWTQMKSLIDAADHAVLGQGFEPIKSERFTQLHQTVLKLCGINEAELPRFPCHEPVNRPFFNGSSRLL